MIGCELVDLCSRAAFGRIEAVHNRQDDRLHPRLLGRSLLSVFVCGFHFRFSGGGGGGGGFMCLRSPSQRSQYAGLYNINHAGTRRTECNATSTSNRSASPTCKSSCGRTAFMTRRKPPCDSGWSETLKTPKHCCASATSIGGGETSLPLPKPTSAWAYSGPEIAERPGCTPSPLAGDCPPRRRTACGRHLSRPSAISSLLSRANACSRLPLRCANASRPVA